MAHIQSIGFRSTGHYALLDNGQEIELTQQQYYRLRAGLDIDQAYEDAGAGRRDPSVWLSDAIHAYHEATVALSGVDPTKFSKLETFENELKLSQAAASIGTLQALLEAAVS